MPTVAQLSDPYAGFMVAPRHGADTCSACFNLTDGYRLCYACAHVGHWLDAMAPIAYSVAGEQLHHALAGYKRRHGQSASTLTRGLAAVLWRHLETHERCLAVAAGAARFSLVTTVPSSDARIGNAHPLVGLVGLVAPVAGRYATVLSRSDEAVAPHRFDRRKYGSARDLTGVDVLLIDDTWTTGANAQSAAAALKSAGARRVGAVVIGRHVNRGWRHNDRHLVGLRQPFDWSACALCAPEEVVAAG